MTVFVDCRCRTAWRFICDTCMTGWLLQLCSGLYLAYFFFFFLARIMQHCETPRPIHLYGDEKSTVPDRSPSKLAWIWIPTLPVHVFHSMALAVIQVLTGLIKCFSCCRTFSENMKDDKRLDGLIADCEELLHRPGPMKLSNGKHEELCSGFLHNLLRMKMAAIVERRNLQSLEGMLYISKHACLSIWPNTAHKWTTHQSSVHIFVPYSLNLLWHIRYHDKSIPANFIIQLTHYIWHTCAESVVDCEMIWNCSQEWCHFV